VKNNKSLHVEIVQKIDNKPYEPDFKHDEADLDTYRRRVEERVSSGSKSANKPYAPSDMVRLLMNFALILRMLFLIYSYFEKLKIGYFSATTVYSSWSLSLLRIDRSFNNLLRFTFTTFRCN
jgi:hypothetical protein